jgi:xanthine dehydrogenase YagR molybdenum-binding subunit
VQLVRTYRNAPAQGPRPERYDFFTPSPRPALDSDRVHFFGQQVAIVVADTFENAQAAAALVNLTFEDDDAKAVIFHDHYDEAVQPPGESDVEIGDFQAAFDAAPMKIDDVWRTPLQNHCQMEPCATTAWWEGDQLTVHTSVQMVRFAQNSLAETLMMPHKSVRLLTRYVGGGFGGKGSFYEDLVLASLAARELGRPVKVALSRQQMMHGTVHRPATELHVRLGATPDGRLTAMSLMTKTHCDRRGNFTEHASNFARNLYAAPNRLTGHRLVRLDLPVASARPPARSAWKSPWTSWPKSSAWTPSSCGSSTNRRPTLRPASPSPSASSSAACARARRCSAGTTAIRFPAASATAAG